MRTQAVTCKVEGGALLYSLFVIAIVSSILAIVITISYTTKIDFISFENKTRVLDNSQSGIHLLLSKTPPVGLNQTINIDLFGNGKDSVILKRKSWGVYEVIISRAEYKKHSAELIAFIGEANEDNTALYLADRNKPLLLAGKTHIEGVCYLPQKGVKRANINTKPYIGKKLIYGEEKESQKTIPNINNEILFSIENEIMDNDYQEDSLVLFEQCKDSLFQSFYEKSLVLFSSSEIDLSGKKITGNIVVKSTKAIYVRANTILENAIIVAPFIYFENTFTGSLQAFASDSIWVGENSSLNFPSVLCTFQDSRKERPNYITIGKNTLLSGTVIGYQKDYDYKSPVKVNIEESAIIEGVVYVGGQIELKGNVYGNLYCNKFTLKTPATIYENHLIDVQIDVTKRMVDFAGPEILDNKGKRTIIEWLN